MNAGDLDDMAALLGDPDVMSYYPAPKARAEALQWIDWNRGLYQSRGHGLWILTLARWARQGDAWGTNPGPAGSSVTAA
jgi:RimJ/RimL family protein N-acetyltransferase